MSYYGTTILECGEYTLRYCGHWRFTLVSHGVVILSFLYFPEDKDIYLESIVDAIVAASGMEKSLLIATISDIANNKQISVHSKRK